jgi:hypothetical protein
MKTIVYFLGDFNLDNGGRREFAFAQNAIVTEIDWPALPRASGIIVAGVNHAPGLYY